MVASQKELQQLKKRYGHEYLVDQVVIESKMLVDSRTTKPLWFKVACLIGLLVLVISLLSLWQPIAEYSLQQDQRLIQDTWNKDYSRYGLGLNANNKPTINLNNPLHYAPVSQQPTNFYANSYWLHQGVYYPSTQTIALIRKRHVFMDRMPFIIARLEVVLFWRQTTDNQATSQFELLQRLSADIQPIIASTNNYAYQAKLNIAEDLWPQLEQQILIQ